jgi:hypothetical protein
LFNIRGRPAHLDTKGFANESLERDGVPVGRPQLELGVALGPQLEQRVLAAVVQFDAADRLRMAAIEAFRQPQDRCQRPDGAASPAGEPAQRGGSLAGSGAPMIAGDQRNGFDFLGLEPAQIAIANQVLGVLVVAFVADVHADVVQDRRILQPLAILVGEAVDRPRLIEQRCRQPRNLLCMLRPVAAPLGELDDAAPANVRIPIGLRDFLPVPRDVIEDDAFTQ